MEFSFVLQTKSDTTHYSLNIQYLLFVQFSLQFAHLLESEGSYAKGGSEDVDMRGVDWKQQHWEMNRMHQYASPRPKKFKGGHSRRRFSKVAGRSKGRGKFSINQGRSWAKKGKGKLIDPFRKRKYVSKT